jgi:hypothetical protein
VLAVVVMRGFNGEEGGWPIMNESVASLAPGTPPCNSG